MIISKKQAIIPAGMFQGLVFLVKRSGEKQNRLTLVEAKNSVLQLWAPMGADGASGATGYLFRVY